MPSNPLDGYGLMLSAIADPNPVMVLLPKALLRIRGDKLIPGEPTDAVDLGRRIDAPLGDRTNWQPDWPDVEEDFVPIGVGDLAREGQAATVISYGQTLPLCGQSAVRVQRTNGL